MNTNVKARCGSWIPRAGSPEGKYFAFITRLDEEIGIWELDKGEIVSLKLGVGVNSVAFSPDGKMILTGNRDNNARLWSLDAITHKKFVGSAHRAG